MERTAPFMIDPASATRALEPMAPVLRAVNDACSSGGIASLIVMVGILDAAREQCLAAIDRQMGQTDEPSQGRLWRDPVGSKVRDRWLTPTDAAKTLGISYRTLARRARKAPYANFCIPQPGRGFKVSALALDEHMRRERERSTRGR